MRVGAKLPNSGALPPSLGIPRMASELAGDGITDVVVDVDWDGDVAAQAAVLLAAAGERSTPRR
jgi:hypothetical protein